MNINYGDTGMMVNYLQYFLRDNYLDITKMSQVYDEYTHKKLINYLDIPNSEEPEQLVEKLKTIEYDGALTSITQALRYPFNAMQYHIEDDSIIFIMKNPNTVEGFDEDIDKNKVIRFKTLIPILKTVYQDVYDMADKNGWWIAEFPDVYRNVSTINYTDIVDITSAVVVLKKQIPCNIFPNFDIRYMVNYFNNDYVNNYMVSNNFFQKSSNYRIGFIPCKTGDRFIIAHGYTYSIPIKIGYCRDSMSDIIDKLYTSTNLASISVRGMSSEIDKVLPGVPILAEVPEPSDTKGEYQTLLILIPNIKYTKQSDIHTQTPLSYVDTGYLVGDINNDGYIDEIDRLIYACQRPKDMGNDYYYFNQDYDRFNLLVECIKTRYSKLFLSNVNSTHSWEWHQYNHKSMYYTDAQGNKYYNIDTIVEHLRFLCSGSDVVFTRYLLNGVINYKITTGENQSNINMTVLSEYNDGAGFTVNSFDEYLSDSSAETILNKYIYDDTGTYARSNTPTQVGLKLICGLNMTSNNLLVIKTNPDDNISDCSKILNGEYNSDEGTLTLPINDFKDNPWCVREEIYTALLDMMVNPYSDQNDISYVFSLISEQNGTGYEITNFNPSNLYIYSDELKKYIQKIQIKEDSPFSMGYFDITAYSVLYETAYQNYLEKQVENRDGANG